VSSLDSVMTTCSYRPVASSSQLARAARLGSTRPTAAANLQLVQRALLYGTTDRRASGALCSINQPRPLKIPQDAPLLSDGESGLGASLEPKTPLARVVRASDNERPLLSSTTRILKNAGIEVAVRDRVRATELLAFILSMSSCQFHERHGCAPRRESGGRRASSPLMTGAPDVQSAVEAPRHGA
jgi:hypothetical protein